MTDVADTPRPRRRRSHVKDWVAIIVAIGLSTAVNLITFAAVYDALFSDQAGLSENTTQILVSVFGGMIGLLGAYIGYRAGAETDQSAGGGQSDMS